MSNRAYLTDEDEQTVVDLEMRLTGYRNAVRSLEPVARVDEELQGQVEKFESRIAKLEAEIKDLETNSVKKLEKARFDSTGRKFKQGDTVLMVPTHGINWKSHHLQSKQVTISKQTAHRLEITYKGETATMYMDPNRAFEPSYLVVYERENGSMDAYEVDNVFVLSARAVEELEDESSEES